MFGLFTYWFGSVFQLFGFVYACYVSRVFLDDEDSCKCSVFGNLLLDTELQRH